MDDTKIYEALGLTPPEPDKTEPAGAGENEQTVAASAPGAEETAGATTEQKNETAAAGSAPGGDETDPPADAAKAKNRQAAAERRRQEQQAAIDTAVAQAVAAERQKYEAAVSDFFARANLVNTITKAPIKSMAEFESFQRDYAAAQAQAELKAGKLTTQTLDEVIASNPTVKRASEIIKANDEAARAQEAAAAKAKIDAELQQIHELDPSISTVADLLNAPNAKEFYETVQQGNSFLGAYLIVNRKRLDEERTIAARQQAAVNARGKDHLKPTSPVGGTVESVPAAELKMFKQINPGATDEEIQAYWQKYRAQNK